MDYRSVKVLPHDMWVNHFKNQVKNGTSTIHRQPDRRPGGIKGRKGMIVMKGKKSTSNEKTTPIQIVEPSEQATLMAKSELSNTINTENSRGGAQSKRQPQKRKIATEKQIKKKTRKVQDILSDKKRK